MSFVGETHVREFVEKHDFSSLKPEDRLYFFHHLDNLIAQNMSRRSFYGAGLIGFSAIIISVMVSYWSNHTFSYTLPDIAVLIFYVLMVAGLNCLMIFALRQLNKELAYLMGVREESYEIHFKYAEMKR
jgi:hypothetical protein